MSQVYYPCNDPNNVICRQHVNRGRCRRGIQCRFYHPPVITGIIKKQARREPGQCYCGASIKRLVNKRAYNPDTEARPHNIFFVVCGRTGRSIKRCMR